MGILKNLFSAKKPEETPAEPAVNPAAVRTLKKEDFFVIDRKQFEANYKKLACVNPEWKKKFPDNTELLKIYHYNYVSKPIKLIPDPSHKYIKNAIAVFVAGEIVGYIKQEDTEHVHDILKNGEIKYITAYVRGGEYKIVGSNGNETKLSENVTVNVRIAYV